MSVESVGGVSTAVRGRGTAGNVPSGGDAESGSAAQSLEALTRRVEVVAEDLERTEGGLVELEAEEAEEAGEEDEDAVADPLDMFMASNRTKERQQATLRLATKRDSLREEQARLKVMVEAARPSMPALKATPKPSSPAAVATEGGTGSSVPGSSPSGKVATAAGNDGSSIAIEDARDDESKDRVKVAADIERAAAGTPEKRPMLSPQGSASMAAPDVLPRRASVPPVAARAAPPPGGDGGDVCDEDKGGQREASPAETPRSSGVKRRGTPVGTAMLPPPAAKRPQQGGKPSKTVAVAPVDSTTDSNPKRPVKGPAAMPPSPGNPLRNVTPLSGGGGGGGDAGDSVDARSSEQTTSSAKSGVLEGGDADWVPPKGQAGDGRTALNLKFGY